MHYVIKYINMRKRSIYLLFCLLPVVLHIQALSNTPCPFAFSKEEEFLSLAEKAENLVRKIEEADFKSTDAEIARLQSDIEQQVSAMFDEVNFSYNSLLKLKKNVDDLRDLLDEKLDLNKKVRVNGAVNGTPTLISLIEDPSIVQVDASYRIDWLHHPQPAYVVFGRKIIDGFFHSKKDVKNKLVIAKKNLKALQVGYAGKHGDTGIKLLTLSGNTNNHRHYYRNKIFEIKTVGKLSGHIRWGGFIDGDSLYVVHYANNTHHNRYKHSFMMALLDKLREFHSLDAPALYRH